MTVTPDDDAATLGIRLAQATAPAFVFATHHLPLAERLEFVRAFLACVSGITQQAIGHDATVEALTFVAVLPPANPRPLQ